MYEREETVRLLLTADEVAHILGLSPFTVRRLLREGELPGRKVGKRQWRIRRVDLEEYLSASVVSNKPKQQQDMQDRISLLAAEQGVEPITDFNQLLGDRWPGDEEGQSVEEFLAPIRELRETSPATNKL
jgi:excisionase family DNA binding protein